MVENTVIIDLASGRTPRGSQDNKAALGPPCGRHFPPTTSCKRRWESWPPFSPPLASPRLLFASATSQVRSCEEWEAALTSLSQREPPVEVRKAWRGSWRLCSAPSHTAALRTPPPRVSCPWLGHSDRCKRRLCVSASWRESLGVPFPHKAFGPTQECLE